MIHVQSLRSLCFMAALTATTVTACGFDTSPEPTAQRDQGVITVSASYGTSVRGTIDGFPFIVLRGTHAERGMAHGVLAASNIINSVNNMATFLNSSGAINWTQATQGLAYFTYAARFEQELSAMLQGIQQALPPSGRVVPALGREINLNDLKILQTGDMVELVGCSQFSAWGPMTANGNVILGRNWDYPPLFSMSDAAIIAVDPAESGLQSTMDLSPRREGRLSRS